MRYRSRSDGSQFSADAAAFANLMGDREYVELLLKLGKDLNLKGFVTAIDDLRFSLERELLSLELLRISNKGVLPGIPAELHEAADFVLGVGQVIPYLSDKARHKLRGDILGRIEKNSLRSLQHEFRIAGMVSHVGFDVAFSNLETDNGGFDFLAQRDGQAFEIEGKCTNLYAGQAIPPEDAEKLFLELRRRFNAWTDESRIPIIDVRLSKRLDLSLTRVADMIDACNAAAIKQNTVVMPNYGMVRFLGSAPESAMDHLIAEVHAERMLTYANVYLSTMKPGFVIRLSSDQESRFVPNLLATLADAAKRQFSGSRPGIIWLHVDYLTPEVFGALTYNDTGSSFFDLVALAVLDSPKRSHVCQLVFSGGSYLERRGQYATSRFKSVVYNAPNCRFGDSVLFPGGRTTIPSEGSRGEKAKSLLRAAKINFNIAAGPRESSLAMTKSFLERLCRSSERRDRITAVGILFHEALKLGEQGRCADSVKVYDELLLTLSDDDVSSQETIAAVCYNRANMLSHMGRREDALEAYEGVITRFSQSNASNVVEKVARALFNKAKILETNVAYIGQAIRAYNQICTTALSSPGLFPQLIVARAYVNMGKLLGTNEAAIKAFNEVIGRFEHSQDAELREQLQKALAHKCHVLEAMNRHTDALEAVDAALALPNPPNPNLELWALILKVHILLALKREHEIPDFCEKIQAGLAPMTDLRLKEACAQSLLTIASVLKAEGDRAAEIRIHETIVAKLGSDADQEIVDLILVSQEKRIIALIDLERSSEALTICDNIVERCDRAISPSILSEHIVWALTVKQSILAYAEKSAEAAEVCSQIIDRFGPNSVTPFPLAVAEALARRAAHLHDLERYEDALDVCDAFLASYGSSNQPSVLAKLAYLLLSKGSCLLATNNKKEAEEVLGQLIARFGGEHDEEVACYIRAARNLLVDAYGDSAPF